MVDSIKIVTQRAAIVVKWRAIAVQSLCNRREIAVQSLCNRFAIAVQSRCKRCATIDAPSLRQSLRNRYAVGLCRCTITVELLRNQSGIASLLCASLRFSALHCASLCCAALRFASLCFSTLHCASLRCSALLYASLPCSALLCSALL